MLNSYWLAAPFVLQMICMAADEFWFHRKRGLPRWERIGHPLDTLTVILCLAWVVCAEPSRNASVAFVLLAVFSCVFVTKDEPVHRIHCSAAEQWLHSILFMLHPLVLTSAFLLWPSIGGWFPGMSSSFVRFFGFERAFLTSVLVLMAGFGVYQYGYWNVRWRPQKTQR